MKILIKNLKHIRNYSNSDQIPKQNLKRDWTERKGRTGENCWPTINFVFGARRRWIKRLTAVLVLRTAIDRPHDPWQHEPHQQQGATASSKSVHVYIRPDENILRPLSVTWDLVQIMADAQTCQSPTWEHQWTSETSIPHNVGHVTSSEEDGPLIRDFLVASGHPRNIRMNLELVTQVNN